ncbi:LysR family transcriptional regulator [Paraburkholderia caballeronis]|uniref:LysR family transcriptional regulator n=1 Tax=Paraburkholderia caballeronis TaxID=416943 RepID=UPI001065F27F|nr:LysR family transcriptional regulator [Paraburkholderia caballeronis]TDV06792.1 LysR family transcriptional regulator [Paraburkholderia caballeronis]TDV09972.1 LysR family transcriptional regulator [Paraburkholderia caballeronis]TDV21804.1 LysR family transcriptional regulator [Paraburkholderia caballeronis]
MADKLDGVAVFVQVIEAGSFTLAAERMHLTRSAVGKVIARLEERLGARLLHRTTRSQTLTEAGRAYYDRCVRALAELDAAETELESGHTRPRGRLRVSAPLAFGHHCVAPVLFGLAHRHPELQIDISFSDRTVDLVEEHIDLAVRIGELRDSTVLAARRLGVQDQSIGAAPSYLARHGTPADIDDFEGHVGIAYSRAGVVSPWRVLDANGVEHELRIEPKLSLDDIQAIAGAGVAGLGLVQLPCWLMTRYVATGELVAVRERCGVRPQGIHAVWPKTPYLPSKTRCAIDALVTEIPLLNLD